MLGPLSLLLDVFWVGFSVGALNSQPFSRIHRRIMCWKNRRRRGSLDDLLFIHRTDGSCCCVECGRVKIRTKPSQEGGWDDAGWTLSQEQSLWISALKPELQIWSSSVFAPQIKKDPRFGFTLWSDVGSLDYRNRFIVPLTIKGSSATFQQKLVVVAVFFILLNYWRHSAFIRIFLAFLVLHLGTFRFLLFLNKYKISFCFFYTDDLDSNTFVFRWNPHSSHLNVIKQMTSG